MQSNKNSINFSACQSPEQLNVDHGMQQKAKDSGLEKNKSSNKTTKGVANGQDMAEALPKKQNSILKTSRKTLGALSSGQILVLRNCPMKNLDTESECMPTTDTDTET
ncbi:Ovule protein [Caenorhabditis elegans]|uniref:Ovule protein n=1 Tax=Caenorhabditis elegans TaxID=6239 RepID=Q21377_CAEEL|nr:Ovule protein [Caenorhabditis elegans]CCD69247.1 Ovule protein [Caenorhabditis elegans]|eukprot:NP_508561.1 Uncharacterized protein CELE_K09C4.9 [Caenorhabditis elegans]